MAPVTSHETAQEIAWLGDGSTLKSQKLYHSLCSSATDKGGLKSSAQPALSSYCLGVRVQGQAIPHVGFDSSCLRKESWFACSQAEAWDKNRKEDGGWAWTPATSRHVIRAQIVPENTAETNKSALAETNSAMLSGSYLGRYLSWNHVVIWLFMLHKGGGWFLYKSLAVTSGDPEMSRFADVSSLIYWQKQLRGKLLNLVSQISPSAALLSLIWAQKWEFSTIKCSKNMVWSCYSASLGYQHSPTTAQLPQLLYPCVPISDGLWIPSLLLASRCLNGPLSNSCLGTREYLGMLL